MGISVLPTYAENLKALNLSWTPYYEVFIQLLCPGMSNTVDICANGSMKARHLRGINLAQQIDANLYFYCFNAHGDVYLAVVKDLCTKMIVGYAFSERIDTSLALEALCMACRRHKPPKGLIFHSDRGVQYAANAYRQQLRCFHMVQSMSRKGDPYDNAVAENFFSCLKCEMVHLTRFLSRAQARNAIFTYIEEFYNAFRPHSGIGWLSPNEFAGGIHSSTAA